jgi:hypothetical protein
MEALHFRTLHDDEGDRTGNTSARFTQIETEVKLHSHSKRWFKNISLDTVVKIASCSMR